MYVHPLVSNGERDSAVSACVSLSSRRITYALSLAILALTAAHIAAHAAYYSLAYSSYVTTDDFRRMLVLFDLNDEGNLAAWYASFTLLVCSMLIGLIAFDAIEKRDGYATHWIILGVIFLYLSVDETAVLHERTIRRLRSALDLGGLLYYSWVIVGIPAILVFALAYLKFFLHLPRTIRSRFFVAAVMYVGGGLGVEMVEGYYEQLYGYTMTYTLIVAVEESLEMVGVLVFIRALLAYVRCHVGEIRLRVDDGRIGPTP